MNHKIAEIYEILDSSPEDANQMAIKYILESNDQIEIDELNWVRAYALVSLENYSEAKQIWIEIFNRTKSHKALHQIGFVERSEGNFEEALLIYTEESKLISSNDHVASGANLYELSYCNFLKGNLERAFQYFHQYELLSFEEIDQIERACFYRLKGDLFAKKDKHKAMTAYSESIKYFNEANDNIGKSDVEAKIAAL